jgi:pectin methylesterase-like acyl-CoA thioesterase
MKNAFLKLISGVLILAFTSCTSVQFYSNPELTQKSGLKYYTVKPYLQVERETINKTIVNATILYLPDLENPQYIAIKDGLGSKKLDLKLADGVITTFGMETDPNIAESITALTALVSKTATAITDLSTMKGIPGAAAPATVTELYDIIMTNGVTSVKKIEVK